jgi:hypothetical protein
MWEPNEALAPLRGAVIDVQDLMATRPDELQDSTKVYPVLRRLVAALLQFAKLTWPEAYLDLQLLVRMDDH